MEIAIIILITVLIMLYEMPPLIKGKMWRELGAFLALLFLGMFLAVAQALDIKVPNPVHGIEYIFQPVSSWVDQVLS